MTLTTLARGFALFVGSFGLANAGLGLVDAGRDANAFWVTAPTLVLVPTCAALLVWSVAPGRKSSRAAATLSAGVLAALCLLDCVRVLDAARSGAVALHGAPPYSALFATLFAATAWCCMRATRPARPLRGVAASALVAAGCAALFPLGLTATLGRADYRRPADAICVLGARTYADGRLSHALDDRVSTAVRLYHEGRAPLLWMSGGPGDGAVHEVEAMRDAAIAAGVPADRIRLDYDGLSTARTARNVTPRLDADATVIAVSHGFHLARVRLAFAREGREVVTVPADSRERPLAKLPRLTVRDAVGFWAYWAGLA